MQAKKRKAYRIVLSVLAIVLTVLSSSFAYSFLSVTGWSFSGRFWTGLILMEVPVVVSLLVIELFWKK